MSKEDPYAHLRVNQGKPCDCPARILREALIGTECTVCAGTIPPFDSTDKRILAYEAERERLLLLEEEARFRRGGRDGRL